MSGIAPIFGLPGMQAVQTAQHRLVFRGGVWDWVSLPGGRIIDGVNARDPDNNSGTDANVLRPGLLMGKITATGLYGATILGVTQGAYTSGGTTLTVLPAQAAELVRRFGSSGTATVNVVGPPTANGTVATTAMTWSAVNTTTGVITITSLGVNKVAGSFIVAGDGSGVPNTIIPDGYGVQVTDFSSGANLSVPFPQLPIGGTILSTQVINWPTDTSLQAWIAQSLSTLSGGKFVWDFNY